MNFLSDGILFQSVFSLGVAYFLDRDMDLGCENLFCVVIVYIDLDSGSWPFVLFNSSGFMEV